MTNYIASFLVKFLDMPTVTTSRKLLFYHLTWTVSIKYLNPDITSSIKRPSFPPPFSILTTSARFNVHSQT